MIPAKGTHLTRPAPVGGYEQSLIGIENGISRNGDGTPSV